MLVKVKAGHSIYREGYLRTEASGVFRLYDVPPSKDEPADPNNPDGPSKFDKWYGVALEEPDDYERMVFENSAKGKEGFAQSMNATSMEETMGRAGAIAASISKLDHNNDDHWLPTGEPSAKAIEEVSGLHNLQQGEVRASCLGYTRTPQGQRAPRKRFTDKG